MAENSKIKWTTHTFNPWRGCTKVHAGCTNCYAEQLSGRNPGTLGVWGPNGTRVVASESMWREPLKWDKAAAKAGERHRVFCASLADVFEDWPNIMRGSGGGYLHHAEKWQVRDGRKYIEIPDIAIGKSRVTMADVRRRLFALIDATPNLDWLLLTKRPENVRKMWQMVRPPILPDVDPGEWYRQNVWIGTSVSDQATYDKYAHALYHGCRDLSPVLFLSAEPLLGPIKLWNDFDGQTVRNWMGCFNWIIVGGESGPHARPYRVEWARSIVEQCNAAGLPCFHKQLGGFVVDRNDAGFEGDEPGAWPMDTDTIDLEQGWQGQDVRVRLKDKKGGNWNEWPADLRCREFPQLQMT